MSENTFVVYLTDKHGGEMFKELINEKFLESAKRNLERHIMAAKLKPDFYHFFDVESAEIKFRNINDELF